MATQAERTAATRRKILDSARSLFVADGYDATTISHILKATAVSKGALYHHFESKQAIAEVVFSETSRHAIVAASRRASDVSDPLDALIESCLNWLDEVSDSSVAVVLFDLGPKALGWERCRQIEDNHSLRALRLGIARAAEAGRFSPDNTALAAHAINAVLAELAWLVFDPGSTRADEHSIAATVDATVRALAGLQ